MAHSSLSLGRGHQIFGDDEALTRLQQMIIRGTEPDNLTSLQAAIVDDGNPDDRTGNVIVCRNKRDEVFSVHGSMPALLIAQAWVLANGDMTRC